MPALPHSSGASILFRDDIEQHTMLFDAPRDVIVVEHANDFEAGFAALQHAHQQGKWLAGYFSYEAGYLLEPQLRHLLPQQRRIPLLCFGVFDQPPATAVPATAPAAANSAQTNAGFSDFTAAWSKHQYQQRFESLHRHLRAGDCYQGNLTFPIRAQYSGEAQTLFNQLAARQPVRYSAMVNLLPADQAPVILSRSPELFFEIDDERWIETRPMKGTTPRGATQEQDDFYRDFLIHDEKSQAENRMIVDLLRNDISLISETGSLCVPKLFHVERYQTVHQMVSHVRAKLRPDLSLRQIFAALFPCGSVTGAPKISAITILQQLEQQPRDIYCGSIGWIAPSGAMRFNVAIRTVSLFHDNSAILNVGGGVVYNSTAADEYAECLLKARYITGSQTITTLKD